jgi:hypothetical protein
MTIRELKAMRARAGSLSEIAQKVCSSSELLAGSVRGGTRS